MEKIVIVGLGLIGGSLAKAFKKFTDAHIVGVDCDEAVLSAALADGSIDCTGTDAELAAAEVLYLCLYPQAALDFMQANGHKLSPNCVVTDTCGVKMEICTHMPALARWYGFKFVGGHPMAGSEKSGYAASSAELFKDASYLFVPCGAPKVAIYQLKTLATRIGFKETVETTAQHHDEMIAFTSQLPHALACAYMMSPRSLTHEGFSAGSYRDVSRVANINETLWAELFINNARSLTSELDLLVANITSIKDAIAQGNTERLRELLKQGREAKERLGE